MGGSRPRASTRRHIAAAAMLAVAAAAGIAWAVARNEPPPESLGALLDRVVEEGAPGALVVVRDGDATRAEARGLADGTPPLPMRPDARFRAGSITKTFVAALVLDLVQDGKLHLDDPVARWLPGLVPHGNVITVRQLLRHTSGLPDYVDDPRVLRAPARRWRPEELLALAAAQAPSGAPGERFAYASTNYVVLGLVAERVGGSPLATLLTRRLFAPLQLRHTAYVPGTVPGRSVHGYRAPSHQGVVTGDAVEVGTAAWWAGAAGAVVSSADDVQRFFAALLGGRLVRLQLLREMETLVPAGRNRYGLGIAVFPTPCGPAWGHTGNVQGTVAVAWNTRDASRRVVLVVNTYPLSAELEAAVRRVQIAAFCGLAATP
jgi:D-alanyl-D-alanine carboxypeptidase